MLYNDGMGTNNFTNALKSHCKRGHPFSGANLTILLKIDGRTERRCKECQRVQMQAIRASRPRRLRPSAEDRFWPKVDKNGPVPKQRLELGACWLWLAARNGDGYGEFSVGGKIVRAHRFSYELLFGTIPDDLVTDHLCLNRACVNPYHLEIVTITVNVFRSSAPSVINAAKTHCLRGHPLEGSNLKVLSYKGHTARYCRACIRFRTNRRRAELRAIRSS